MQAAAVIPVYNRAELLGSLLATLHAQTVPFARIIVVDNASTDDAGDVARAAGCQVIRLARNTGFAHAVNIGCREASEPWVAILNSDVELDPRWLELLLGAVSAGPAFAAGTIFDAARRTVIDGTYDLVSRAGCAWRVGHGETSPLPAAPVAIHSAPGTACLFRRTVLESLGGYDESFGSYLEDVDLGLRCVAHGLAGVFVPNALAWHHGSASLGRWHPEVVRLLSRNQLLLLARHYDRALFRRWLWPIVVGQLLWGLVALRHGAFAAWYRGKRDAVAAFNLQGHPSARFSEFLAASEAEIRRRSRDSYWRWYFRLVRAAH